MNLNKGLGCSRTLFLRYKKKFDQMVSRFFPVPKIVMKSSSNISMSIHVILIFMKSVTNLNFPTDSWENIVLIQY